MTSWYLLEGELRKNEKLLELTLLSNFLEFWCVLNFTPSGGKAINLVSVMYITGFGKSLQAVREESSGQRSSCSKDFYFLPTASPSTSA